MEQKPNEETPAKEPKLDYVLEHREFIEENDIELKKVPVQIRKKMGIMNMLIGRYKNNPSAPNKNTLIKTDITICDMLQDWKERDYPDNYVEPVNTPKETPAEETPVVNTTPTPNNTVPNPNDAPPQVDESAMEAIIMDSLDGSNKINVSTLASIIKKTPEYPIQKVGKLRLRKIFLSSSYQLEA